MWQNRRTELFKMVKIHDPVNYIGDSWLNACLHVEAYAKVMDQFFNHMFRWTEPHLLVSCCLVILFLLPLIFMARPDDSFLKISRLYNVSRLSVLIFFHRVVYIYLIFAPLAFAIGQNPPCYGTGSDVAKFERLVYFPSAKYASLNIVLLYIGSLFCVMKKWWVILFVAFLVFMAVHFVMCGDLSVAQAAVTLSLCYIVHFYAQRIPFFVLHIENAVLPMFFSVILLVKRSTALTDEDMLGRTVSAFSLWLADFFMLGRYHCTRAGVATVGRPTDLEYEMGANAGVYFSVLSEEEEDKFSWNLKMDIIDSVVAAVLYCVGLFLRHYVSGPIKSSAGGLL